MWLDELLSRRPAKRDGNNLIFDLSGSDEWLKAQKGAEDRYSLADYNSPTDLAVSALFGGFIATDLASDAVILDVGCGPFGELQPYVSDLRLKRYIGLEPLAATPERSYPCLVGAVAEDIPLSDNSVDAAILATSLDHIEDEDGAMKELKRVLKPNGRILIWQGLYDVSTVAEQKTFRRTLEFGLIVGVPLIALEGALTAWRMWDRKRKLANGTPLDNVHFRYYTRPMMEQSIERWEMTKQRSVEVPGSTALFVELRPLHPS